MPCWDRERETAYLEKYIADVLNSILFVYGSKSSGKSTTMMKIISESKKDKAFFYYNLRETYIADYKEFLNQFFIEKSTKQEIAETLFKIGLKTINLFEITDELIKKIKEKKTNEFKIMKKQVEKLKQNGKKPSIVIDELQKLKDIYFNSRNQLLEELFNFFVTITKIKYLANVICMSSDSLFIDEVYNNSILEKTSKFYFFYSFDKKTTVEWLLAEEKDKKEAENVFDILSGKCWYLQEYLRNPKSLDEMIDLKEGLFRFYLADFDKEKRQEIKDFLRVFNEKEEIIFNEEEMNEKLMKELVNKEILFYDSQNKLIKPQSCLMLNVLRRVL